MNTGELIAEIKRHNRLYWIDHRPEIRDEDYDRLVEILRKRKPDAKELWEIFSDARPFGSKVQHQSPILSLDKCYDEEGIAEWAQKIKAGIVASPKIDGLAVSIKYDSDGLMYEAATRGSGWEGENITQNVFMINDVPRALNVNNVVAGNQGIEVRGEIYMPLSVFRGYSNQNANPRNLAAGAVKQKDPNKTAAYRLSFFAYDLLGAGAFTEEEKYKLLKKFGFPVVEWKRVGENEFQNSFSYYLKKRLEYDFETDGVVFKANSVEEQAALGYTAHHPRYAIAYKFQGDSGTTTLVDVEWSVARTGVITPVAIVEPVELSGAMVRRASLHNVGIMQRLGVAKGAKVLMMRRGGVIPNLEQVVGKGKGTIAIPKRCPSCGSPTRLEEDFLYCTTPKACVQSKIGELAHFVKTVGIDGFGDKLLAQLYENGIVTDPAELYDLTADDLMPMERMGETLAAKLLANIAGRRRVPLDLFLQGLGIRELGKHAAKILAQFGTLAKVRQLGEGELSAIHTIGPVIAKEVVEGLKAKRSLIEKLLERVAVEEGKAVAEKTGPLAGQSFLFTGKLIAMERGDAQKLVEELGGVAAQSVTKELDYLVVGDGGGAGSKLAKAEKLVAKGGKVKVITEAVFLRMVKP